LRQQFESVAADHVTHEQVRYQPHRNSIRPDRLTLQAVQPATCKRHFCFCRWEGSVERLSIPAIFLLVGVGAAQAQVNPPQVNPGQGNAVTAAPATSSNPSGATTGNPRGITFCTPSSGFILGALNCGNDPLSVPTSVISSGPASGAAAASAGPGGSSSTSSQTTSPSAASNSTTQASNSSASAASASATPCSLTMPSTAGTLNPSSLVGGC